MRYLVVIISVVLLLAAPSRIFAQMFWAQGIGGNGADETMDICYDNSGNIITAGYFTNTAQFGSNISLSSASIGVNDIFVSKSSSSGNTLWAVRAGGAGSDRALSVKCDASGNIYITGYYYGTATFGSFTLISMNGSKDLFIAKMDANGNFIWAVSAGGNLGDMGNSIDVDNAGNVLITGQFEGTATFGPSSFTSITNPNLNVPSIDVFTSKLDNNGSFLWTRTGAAEFTDRGLDIASDNTGNIYVCGQFSDTITFGQVHNNPVMNAIFLIKYDPNGNETWFTKASGTFSIAYGLVINSAQEIFITGDYQGTLAFYGSPNNFLSDNYSKRVFLAKYSSAGTFQWAQSLSSDNYLSSRSIAIDPAGDLYIYGEYGCTFNDLSDLYGAATFNSIGYQDLFVAKYNASGQPQWQRNFGGPKNDKAHGIIVQSPNKPVIAGSYDNRILWPVSSLSITAGNAFNHTALNSAYCNDPSYGNYEGLRGKGFSDGFAACAIDISRQPYDYYYRTGSSCIKNVLGGCIEDSLSMNYQCIDTLGYCERGTLIANTFTGVYDSIGPFFHYSWSSSPADTLEVSTIVSTGYYSVVMTTIDGCYQSEDSVYAEVHPKPQAPSITDNHGYNINQGKWANHFSVCSPDTVLLVTGNYNPSDTISWYYTPYYNPNAYPNFSGTLQAVNDSLATSSPTGWYYTVTTTQYGCTDTNAVFVGFDTQIPQIIAKPAMPDTITACYNTLVPYIVYDSISNPFANAFTPMNYITATWSSNPPGLSIVSTDTTSLGGNMIAQNSGTYIVTETIYYHNACGAATYYMHDTITVIVNPVPTITMTIGGPPEMCAGDTIQLPVTINASTWANTLLTYTPAVSAITVTQQGTYTGFAHIIDTITGCASSDTAQHVMNPKEDPEILLSPSSGLICPNDSVQLTCNTAGYNFVWAGPNGVLPFNTQSIYSSIPGFYYCIVLDMDSCVLTSTTVELKQYNTPYLIATPGNMVCLGEEVTLQVITNDTTLIQWLAPLSGGGTQQVVTQTGTYSCNVTMCGVTTLCSIQVIASQAVAQITAPAILCPGDSAWIKGNTGMAAYQWSTGSGADSIFVGPGTYMLMGTDMNGCFAQDTVTIALDTSVTAPVTSNVIICMGDSASLTATAFGPVEWYTSATAGAPVFSGNPFVTPAITSATTFFAATYDSTGCHSLRTPVNITISPASLTPVVTGDSLVCNGDSISLAAGSAPNAVYSWTGPNGFTSALQNLSIPVADTSDSGVYTLIISDSSCTSSPASFYVQVLLPVAPVVSFNDSVCEGSTVTFIITNSQPISAYSWTGPNGFTSTVDTVILSPADTNDTGLYTVVASENGCISNPVQLDLAVLPAAGAAVAVASTSVCEGDTIFLQASAVGATSFLWQGPNGFSSSLQNPVITPALQSNSGLYTVTGVTSFGCMGIPGSTSTIVNPLPVFTLANDTSVCSQDNFMLYGPSGFTSYLWQDNSTSGSILVDHSGVYTLIVTDANGCSSFNSTVMTLIDCSVARINVFTPNGDGINDYFTITAPNAKNVTCTIYNRYGNVEYEWTGAGGRWDGNSNSKPASEGTYFYTATIETFEGKIVEITGHVLISR